MTDNGKDKWRLTPRSILLAIVAVTVVWLFIGNLPFAFLDLPAASNYGDAFGVVNSLFSALAFLGIIATILLQRQELQLQREELEATRQELRRSAEAQEKSEAALREQVEWLSMAPYLQALLALRDADDESAKYVNAEIRAIVEIGRPRLAKEGWELIYRRDRQRAHGLKPLLLFAIEKELRAMTIAWQNKENTDASVNDATTLLTNSVPHIELTASHLKESIYAYQLIGGIELDSALATISSLVKRMSLLMDTPESFWIMFSDCVTELAKAGETISNLPDPAT